MERSVTRRLATTVLTASLVLTAAPAAAFAAPQGTASLAVQDDGWTTVGSGRWMVSSGRWWYALDEGGFAQSEYRKIQGVAYAFDADGWMVVGWHHWNDDTWCYAHPSGALANGWAFIGGKWYHFTDYDMDTGWFTDGSGVYYLGTSGAMSQGWRQIGGSWYYFYGSGARATGWVFTGGNWYYFDGSGVMQTGRLDMGADTYFLEDEDGVTKYPLGAMYHDQWITWTDLGKRSYFQPSGIMARNVMIGQYWIDADGYTDIPQ